MMIARTCSNMVTGDPDLWGHTLYGIAQLETGHIARVDPYSYTVPGGPWINHEWLCELIFAWSWQHFGAAGLWGVRLGLFAAVMLIVVRLIRESTRGLWCGLITLTACWIEINRGSAIRPQLFTMALLAIFLLVIRRVFEQRRWPPAAAFLFVPLMALWTNLHGGFVVGLGLVVLTLMRELAECARGLIQSRRLIITITAVVATIAATSANPYGWRLWAFLSQALGEPAGRRITEWGSAFSFSPQNLLIGFYVTLILLAIAAPAMRRARDGFELIVLLGMAAASLAQTRHGPLFCVVAAAWLPHYLEVTLPRFAMPPRFPKPFLAGIATVAFVFAVGTHLRPGGRPTELLIPAADHPLDAYRFIRDRNLRGNLLVMFDWAQSALWYLHDRCKVAYDGRFNTVYPMFVENAYFAFHNDGPNWSRLLDQYPTDMVLVPQNCPGFEKMQQRPDWVVLMKGSQRDGIENAPCLFVRRSRNATAPESLPVAAGDYRFGMPLDEVGATKSAQ